MWTSSLYCSTHILVKRSRDDDELAGVALGCGKWSCPDCAKRLRARIKARVLRGKPTKFLTLTVNPAIGNDSLHRREMLADAWKRLVAQIKRRYHWPRLDYYVVVEETQRGEPHFHVALRCGFIDQAWLSRQMRSMIGAPIVDIRRVRDQRGAAKYLAKYLSKEPAEWKGKRRCWPSHAWAQKPERKLSIFDSFNGYWTRVKASYEDYMHVLMSPRMTVYAATHDTFYAATEGRYRDRRGDVASYFASRAPPQRTKPRSVITNLAA